MADGQTHSRINLVNGIVLTGATAFWWHPDWQTTVAVGVGCLIGWLITPDLDLVGVTYEEKRVYRFNWLVGFLWQLYWLAYSRMMPPRGLSPHGAGRTGKLWAHEWTARAFRASR